MFRPEVRDGKIIGHALETEKAYFFFGTKDFPRADHRKYFPHWRFAYLKQVHGRAVLQADPHIEQEGDAHFTQEKGLALVSQTADCTPILLANTKTVCAIHSGWRGTELNIAGESQRAFIEAPPLWAAIGPHILKNSFEVGDDVAARLEAAPGGQGLSFPHANAAKRYFDLTEMVRRQLRAAYGADLVLEEWIEDTVSHLAYYSFRREKQRAGRQYSFVVLKP